MKKLIVDDSVCIGCGMCTALDEEHFEMNSSSGLSEVKTQEHLETSELQNAIDSCPVSAIKLTEEAKDNTIEFVKQDESAEAEPIAA